MAKAEKDIEWARQREELESDHHFRDGVRAWLSGDPPAEKEDMPGDARTKWLCGYYDAKSRKAVGDCLRRFGVHWEVDHRDIQFFKERRNARTKA